MTETDTTAHNRSIVQRHEHARQSPDRPPDVALPAQSWSLDDLLRDILELIADRLDAGLVFLSRLEGESLHIVRVHDPGSMGLEQGTSVPLCDTYCSTMLAQSAPSLVVADAANDPAFAVLSATRDLGIGAYSGVTLYTSNRTLYGTLCALYRESRPDQAVDVALLRVCGEIIMRAVDRDAQIRRVADDEARKRYGAVTRAAHDAIITAGQDGSIDSWNEGAERLFGYSADDVLGRPLTILMPERFREEHQSGFERFQVTGTGPVVGRTVELTAIHRDGTEFPIELSVATWHADGRHHVTGIVRDISERKKAEARLRASEERYRTIFAAAPIGVALSDADGRIVVANAAYQRMLGYTAEELSGRRFHDFTHPDDLGANLDLFSSAFESGADAYQLTKRYIHRDGHPIWVQLTVTVVRAADGQAHQAVAMVEDITERKRAEDDLVESEARHRQMFEANHAIKLIVDPADGTIMAANSAASSFYGYPPETLVGLPITAINTLPAGTVQGSLERVINEGNSHFVFPHQLASGEVRQVEIHSSPMQLQRRTVVYSIIHDVTERVRAEEALIRSEKGFRRLFRLHPDPMFVCDGGTLQIVEVNEAAVTHYGHDRADFMKMSILDLTLEPERCRLNRQLADARDTFQLRDPWIQKTKDGCLRDVEISGQRLRFQGREAVLVLARDVTESRRVQRALEHQALHDQLTDLPNRSLLHDRLTQALLTSQRNGTTVALLLMDLDGFKEVNDTFGHHFGDRLLQQLGPRLRAVLRESDTIARLGGDEIAVVLPHADESGAVTVGKTLLAALARPFEVEGQPLTVHASIGIALAPAHGTDATVLLQRADVAMYIAKRARNGTAVYRAEQDQHSPERLALIGDLRHAIERGQLLLHYQPKVGMRTGIVDGVEALVRWRHPERGLIPPDRFIGLAEQTGLIYPLTLWVLDRALEQCRAWHDVGLPLCMAVNLSARTLQDPGFADAIGDRLRHHGVEPQMLEVELTESAVMDDPFRAIDILTRLHRLGIQISIDDFGTGYSSLAYLKRLPVDHIKIDRSFVQNMADDVDDQSIVRATIRLGHDLGLTVVAEGVETDRTWEHLRQEGCDAVQGYYVSRPLPAEECERWVREWPPLRAIS